MIYIRNYFHIYILLLISCLFAFAACDNEHGDVVFSNPFDPDNPETKGNPYNLSAEAKTDSVSVKWDSIANTEGVVIYRSTSPDSGFTQVGTSTSGEYIDTDIESGETYYYQVRAYRGGTDAPASVLTDRSKITANALPVSSILSHKLEGNVLSVEWTGTDEGGSIAGYFIKLDSGQWTDLGAQTEFKSNELDDGDHKFYVKAYDNLGSEEEEPQFIEFTVDSTPPEGASITIDGGASVTNSRNVALTISAPDASEMRISNSSSFSDDWVEYQTNRGWTLSSGDGTKTVYAQFRDQYGNIGDTVSDSIRLDTQVPSGSITINNGSATTSSRTVSLTFSASGADEMRISNTSSFSGSWQTYTTSKSWTLASGDGTKTVYVQFRDEAGNTSGTVSDSIQLSTSVVTESLAGSWCATLQNGGSSNEIRIDIDDGEEYASVEVRVSDYSGYFWDDMYLYKYDTFVDIDLEFPDPQGGFIDIYFELEQDNGQLVGIVENLYGGDEILSVTFSQCQQKDPAPEMWCGNSFDLNMNPTSYMEFHLDRTGALAEGTIYYPYEANYGFDFNIFYDIINVVETGDNLSFAIQWNDASAPIPYELQFQDGKLFGSIYDPLSGNMMLADFSPCSGTSNGNGNGNGSTGTSVYFDFEDGSLAGWEVVDEKDINPEEPESDWGIGESELGLSGKVLYQDSYIWGDSTDSCLMGTFIIYKGQKFTNFVMEIDVAAGDSNGMGLVWGYEGTDDHYRAIMVNNEWPETPVDGIQGPFFKISRRISDQNPWYETLGFSKDDYVPYAEEVPIHWTLTAQDGIFTFTRSDGSSLTVTDFDYSGGYVGIQLYAQPAEFDNISISSLDDMIIDIDIKDF